MESRDFNKDCLWRVNVWCWEMDGSRGLSCPTVSFPRSSVTLPASWDHAMQSLGDDAQGFCSMQLFRDPRQL